MTVNLVQTPGGVWLGFSARGEQLVDSATLQLPLSALDAVSVESLSKVTARAAQIVEVASLEAAFSGLAASIDGLAQAMIENPQRFARNEAVGLRVVADRYLARNEALAKALDPPNQWLRNVLATRHQAFRSILERVERADSEAYLFQKENWPSEYGGETWDRKLSESSNRVEALGWWGVKQVGDVFTLGGQSDQAENVRMYRRGEISLNDYEKNWGLGVARVGFKATVTALTAGRATGPAMRFLGLEAGTSAAIVVTGAAEGMSTGFAQAFSNDVYAWLVANVSTSPGVVAFHEQSIGGPSSWVEAGASGAVSGMALPAAGRLTKAKAVVRGGLGATRAPGGALEALPAAAGGNAHPSSVAAVEGVMDPQPSGGTVPPVAASEVGPGVSGTSAVITGESQPAMPVESAKEVPAAQAKTNVVPPPAGAFGPPAPEHEAPPAAAPIPSAAPVTAAGPESTSQPSAALSTRQLRQRAAADPEAAEALRLRYRAMSDRELSDRARRGDAMAESVQSQRVPPDIALQKILGDDYRPPHEANAVVRDASGRPVWSRRLNSSNMTAPEKALGFPKRILATHTEARAVAQAPLAPGSVMSITGQYDPCGSCQRAMQSAATSSRATIIYWWPGGQMTFRPEAGAPGASGSSGPIGGLPE